jgi:tetratricopeptide (TPR) repeat protein
MENDLAQKAVSAALNGNWPEAVKINKRILKGNSKDTETLNRLAKAFFELGEIKQARQVCQRVLTIDQFNSISLRNLDKWKKIKNKAEASPLPTSASDFIEEAGKTKTVILLNPGDAQVLAKLNCGDEVFLFPHTHRVSVVDSEKKYLGRLPDDLSARLRRFFKMGNTSKVLLKSINDREIKVFIKAQQPCF